MPAASWWSRRTLQQKVAGILLLMLLPVAAAASVQVVVIQHLRTVQHNHRHIILAREQLQILRRLVVDIEDAFRGFLLTQDHEFLVPMLNAEREIPGITNRLVDLIGREPAEVEIRNASTEVRRLLESKHQLIERIERGEVQAVVQYVSSREGMRLSNSVLSHLRRVEDQLDRRLEEMGDTEAALADRAFWGLLVVILTALALGTFGAVLLSRSVIRRVRALQAAVARFGQSGDEADLEVCRHQPLDEIGSLSGAVHEMGHRIRQQIHELETLSEIGHDINTIDRDGLAGVLRRITNYAVELMEVDLCLVLLLNPQMRCWIVEAASGPWNDRLYKSVMLWEEFPVCVQAFELKHPVIGDTPTDAQVSPLTRRNLTGKAMLAIPLLSRTEPFGVLVLVKEQRLSPASWNLRLAKGMAEEAAIAIANARLYEEVHQQGMGAKAQIRELQSVAEVIAHDLKAPGERIEGLAALILADTTTRLSESGERWLTLIQENGKELREHVQQVLGLARLGAQSTAVEAVDPRLVLNEVLKSRSPISNDSCLDIEVPPSMPLLACHGAYLRQVFDNLIGNALAAVQSQPRGHVIVTCGQSDHQACFTVSDNGPGIPPDQRERVFDPFVRLEPERKAGNGIGLTIVKRIVELYGGRIWIETSSMGGCAVVFTVPIWADLRPSSYPPPLSSEPLQWRYGS